MKQRERREQVYRQVEEFKLTLPFFWLAPGEAVSLHRHPTGEPVFYLQDEAVYQYGVRRPPFYLSFDGTTICRYGDGRAVYWARDNFLYAYTDPPGHGPALYFDDTGQREQREQHEAMVKERERLAQELRDFDERASLRSPAQQAVQKQSPYRVFLQRLFDFLSKLLGR